jgi:hypothetical protein
MTRRKNSSLPVALLLCLACITPAVAEDWPRWGGPRGDGTWNGPKLPEKWPDGGLSAAWRKAIGGGYGGIAEADGHVFVTGYWAGSKAIRLGKRPEDAEMIWEENRYLRGLMAQPLYRGGHVYSIDKAFGLTCFELSTGKKVWDDGNKMTPRGHNPQATLVWLGDADRAIILNELGDLILARLSPKGYEEQSRTNIIAAKEGSPIWAHPAYAGNCVYARSDSELVCVKLPVAKRNPLIDAIE